MIKTEEKNDDSFYLISDSNENEININQKNYLFNHFLIKENKDYFSDKKYIPQKEIMPEYIDINTQIQKKINDIREFYNLIPIFKDMQSKNSYVMTIFKKGFKDIFFGPKGIVTRKSSELIRYYKSFESKSNLNSKIYAGSLDYYDYLSNYNSFFERLKNSRRKMLKINGNFSVANDNWEKLRAFYDKYQQKRKIKGSLIQNVSKTNSNYFNKKQLNQKNDNNKIIYKTDTKSKTNNNFYKRFLKKSQKIFLGNNNSEDNKPRTENIFLSYKKGSEIYKNKDILSNKNLISHKINEYPFKNKLINISLPPEEIEDNSKIRKNRKEKTEIYPKIRQDKKHFTNITTISLNHHYHDLTNNNANSSLFSSLINKSGIKNRNSFKLQTPTKLENEKTIQIKDNININDSVSKSNSKNINKNSKKKISIDNYTSTKSLRYEDIQKEKTIKYMQSLEAIKSSLRNKIDSSMPKSKKFEYDLNKFIENNKKYVLKKKDMLKQRMKEELFELKEDMQSNDKYSDIPKNVDFSDVKRFSPNNNYKVKNRIKGSSFNLAFSYKSKKENNLPIKDFLHNLEVIKEKEKEKKYLKYIRKNFKKNIKVIHNLTISLDCIKKKYNY